MTSPRRVVIVGGGITGLTTAFSLATRSAQNLEITLLEASNRTGGLIHSSPFAGLDSVDEGADAFLSRVPWAVQLAADLGLSGALTSPAASHAWIWHNKLHPIPGDIMLGVPASVGSFATSKLFSLRGKLRASADLVLPRRKKYDSQYSDCIGAYIRSRFGNEVQEFLVDPLVGSIYAADTDNFSIEAVPQIASLTTSRSMLLAARNARKNIVTNEPVFKTPLRGMGSLVGTLEQRVTSLGVRIVTDCHVQNIQQITDGSRPTYNVISTNGVHTADAIVVTSPAKHSARFMAGIHPQIGEQLSKWEHADVILVTLAIPRNQWRKDLTGSGYLVPKPDQRWITAVSFGSHKWAHWKNANDDMILRVSLGRDGVEVMHLNDDEILNLTLADLKMHLGEDFAPTAVRITRWKDAFPQYRPHHFSTLNSIEKLLSEQAPGVCLAGASYRGIGVPACVQQALSAAETTVSYLADLAD